MFAEMIQPRFENFHMVVALGKRLGFGGKLIPQFTHENQFLFRGETAELRNFFSDHAARVAQETFALKTKATLVTPLPKERVPLAQLSPDDPSTVEVFQCCIKGRRLRPVNVPPASRRDEAW